LHTEELHNLCFTPDIRAIKSWSMRWQFNVGRMGELRNPYRILVRKSEWKIPLGRRKCRWEDNIKLNLKDIS
jgi:hypothetical protein